MKGGLRKKSVGMCFYGTSYMWYWDSVMIKYHVKPIV